MKTLGLLLAVILPLSWAARNDMLDEAAEAERTTLQGYLNEHQAVELSRADKAKLQVCR